MTLKLKIINEGNNPRDTVVLKGIRVRNEPDGERVGYGEITGNPDDKVSLIMGEAIELYPKCGHFDAFQPVYIKGKN